MPLLAPALLSLLPLLPAAPQDERVDAWSEDLFFLVEEIDRLHPTPYHGVSQEEFEEAVSLVYERIPDLTDDQVTVELMRLFGLHGRGGKEGHCGLYPFGTFGSWPVRPYAFEEGWFVVEADAAHEDLIGARFVAIEGTPMKEVVAAVTPLSTKDNDTNLLGKLPNLVRMPPLLHALGITAERERATVTFAFPDGTERDVVLGTGGGRFRFTLPANPEVLWLEDPADPWWIRHLADERTLYVQYNLTREDNRKGQTLVAFAAEVVKAYHANDAERLVVDVRSNGGGNNRTFGPLVQAIARDPAINRRGRLFCLMGRQTFSAAGNFVTVFERDTEVVLIGEPTGGGPNQYGDTQQVTLPNHPELMIFVSTLYHEFDAEHLDRLTHEPHLAVPLRAEDYFAGRDAQLAAALAFEE